MRLLLAGLCIFMLAGAVPAQDTLKPGDIISGKLRLVTTTHPNGTPLRAYQIVVSTPKALAAKDEFCGGPPKTFHLVAMDTKTAEPLKRRLGKIIAVQAEDLMCSQTAWHIGDAVVFKWRLEPARQAGGPQ